MALPAWADANVDQRFLIASYAKAAGGAGPLTAQDKNDIIKEWARENFGALAAYLDQPEIGPLIMQAAQGGWSGQKLMAAVSETTFWKTTPSTQREWDALVYTDKASADQKVAAMATQIRGLLEQEGVSDQYDDAKVTTLATTLLRNGTAADEVPRFVLADAQLGGTPSAGKLGARMTQVQQTAFEYGLPMGDAQAWEVAKKVETGQMTAEGVADLFKIQAKAAYGTDPNLSAQIDAGFTLRQVLSPQINTAAQLLGVDPNTIDFRDPKWADVVAYDPGNGTRRVANAAETATIVRKTDDYWQGAQGEADAAKFVTQLAGQFGKA